MATQSIGNTPAWKRIGLELKRPAQPTREVPSSKKKRRLGEINTTIASPQIPPAEAEQRKIRIRNAAVNSGNQLDSLLQSGVAFKKPRNNKSVSFSSGTKLEDGDGVVDLSSKDNGVQIAQRQKTGPKKVKNRAMTDALVVSSPSSTKTKHSDAVSLDYLISYSENRTSWKFNKTHQTWLLKNLFNIHRIPVVHDEQLVSYFAGLKGQNARYRLKSDAEACLAVTSGDSARIDPSEDIEEESPVSPPMNPSEDPKMDPDASERTAAMKARAKKILEALATHSEMSSLLDNSIRPTSIQNLTRRNTKSRGRKRRTGPVLSDDEDESSNSSNVESSQGSSESNSEEQTDSGLKASDESTAELLSLSNDNSSESSELSSSSDDSD